MSANGEPFAIDVGGDNTGPGFPRFRGTRPNGGGAVAVTAALLSRATASTPP